jgi:uncharacterized membrane protein
MLFSTVPMDAEALYDRFPSLADADGALLLLVGASRRSTGRACLAVSSVPLLYRGITGHWPDVLNGSARPDSTRSGLGGDRDVHVRESIRLEVPVGDVYRFRRRLENLPHFMTHLDRRADSGIHQGSVPPTASRSSQWAPTGSCSRPAGSKQPCQTGNRIPV